MQLRIKRIGDPFVPRWLEGVSIHVVLVQPGVRVDSHVRVVIPSRGAAAIAETKTPDAEVAVRNAILEDIERRPKLYDAAFTELETRRAAGSGTRPALGVPPLRNKARGK